MKKVLFFALMAAAVLGCKRSPDINTEPEPEPELTDAIMLSSGNTVALSRAAGDTTANQGPRLNEFVLGDQIGLYAVYTDRTALPGTPKPDWANPGTAPARSGRYFDNKPATCNKFVVKEASTPAVRWASFLWGDAGQGGVGIDQLYPKGEDSIFVYGYYPYHADSMVMSVTEGPRRKIILDTMNALKQADVLWSVGKSQATVAVPYVKRLDPLTPLTFKHALAQLNFKVYKKGDKVADASFVSISFHCPVYGEMRITDGHMYVTSSADSMGTYNIKDTQVGVTDIQYQADIKDIPYLLNVPYMVLPMSQAQAQGCKLVIKLYAGGEDGNPTDDPGNIKTYDIALTNLKAFVQGSLNTILLSVGDTPIAIMGDIEPWDNEDGNDSGLDIE